MNDDNCINRIQKLARKRIRPDNSEYQSLLYADECTIANQTGLSLLEVEYTALKNNIVPERYCRNQKSISNVEQLILLQSHVAVVGLGGLGGTVTEILARLGVGTLTLVDGDCFDESNLNRQLLSSISCLGKSKAKTAQRRVSEINPAVEVQVVEDFLTAENGQHILQGARIAVDCLDTIPDRFILEDSCHNLKIPFVSAAIGGTSGQATAIFPEDTGLELIYGSPDKAPKRGIEATLGTLPFAAMYMAAVQCAEVTTILLNKDSRLQNKLLLADIKRHEAELVELANK